MRIIQLVHMTLMLWWLYNMSVQGKWNHALITELFIKYKIVNQFWSKESSLAFRESDN